LGPEAINGAVNGGGDCHKEGNGTAPDNTAPEPEGGSRTTLRMNPQTNA